MTLRLDRKPEGAKLLRVELETDGGLVRALKVRGDFFAHPEEIFEEAEDSLRGLALSDLGPRALLAFSHPGLSLYGASAEGIAETLVLAAAPALGPAAG